MLMVKIVILFFLMKMMGFSATIEDGRYHQQLDPNTLIVTTQMVNNHVASYYYSSSKNVLPCKCFSMSVSCHPSCQSCGCLDPDNGHGMRLCMCNDVHKNSCPHSCKNCLCSHDL
ncbi:hypothetical protein PIB30_074942 [Stylosanthes scabra]|uniref:Uncharacterized protein n=1 Tax=Stylosanthes scabra TaxID=79078 RepID=A0ABU6WN65_9FABA|nr:hypothetical protein [Stylosanthes scabra]